MTRIADQISKLQSASSDIRKSLSGGPLTTGALIVALGYSEMNFVLTKMIGDGAGQWDGSPHQLALSDMVDDGTVIWWRDADETNFYRLSNSAP